MERDRLHITYDSKMLTPGQVVEVVRKQGFQGTILSGEPPDRPLEERGN